MRLNVIIPTYNRAESLRKTLLSIARAETPAALEVHVTVADNNSSDNTPGMVEELRPSLSHLKLNYIFEKKQGRSFAINSAIRSTDGELITAVDDDQEIAADWLVELERMFTERWDEIDFAGGKILPYLEIDPPSWVEPLKVGPLGWRDFGDEEWVYSRESPMLGGGHGIFKREVLEQMGLYSEDVTTQGRGFIAGEDDVLYDQLISGGFRGIYSPNLIMYHYVPARRLTKTYYRNWLFGSGISHSLSHLHYKPFNGRILFGVPRWMYRAAVGGAIAKVRYALKGDESGSLGAEKDVILLAGYFYGANIRGGRMDGVLQSLARRIVTPPSR